MREGDRRPWSRPSRLFLAASVGACVLFGFRVVLSGDPYFLRWLIWNLFLAWIPYVLASWIGRLAERYPHGHGVLVPPTLAWLLFFPNAPYVVTDYVHLQGSSARALPFDVVLIGVFALLSLVLGIASLARIHRVVHDRLGARVGWAFAGVVCVLAGVGVWMGRVLRWNSWDVLTNPMGLLKTTVGALLDPVSHPEAIAFSLGFGLALLAVYAVSARWAKR